MSKFKWFIAAVAIIGIVSFIGYYALAAHGSKTSENMALNAKSYESHGLTSPFNLLSKTELNGTLTYFYQVNSSVEDATLEAKKQLTGGGYQSNVNRPDTKSTVYRDLITGDISVIAIAAPTAAGRTGVTVTVTSIGKGK